jgi:hypothetical protein
MRFVATSTIARRAARAAGLAALALLGAAGAATVCAHDAGAQNAGATAATASQGDPLARLDAPSRAAVEHALDSARTLGLPTDPLVAKVAEGVSKGASGERIVRVVREMVVSMAGARDALGPASTDAELVAGAGALQAGAAPGALKRVRAAQPGRSATQPLVVLADLARRGVPAGDAAGAVARLIQLGASDAELARLRTDIARDVAAGVAPAAATSLRVDQFSAREGAQRSRPPVTPPEPPNTR